VFVAKASFISFNRGWRHIIKLQRLSYTPLWG